MVQDNIVTNVRISESNVALPYGVKRYSYLYFYRSQRFSIVDGRLRLIDLYMLMPSESIFQTAFTFSR